MLCDNPISFAPLTAGTTVVYPSPVENNSAGVPCNGADMHWTESWQVKTIAAGADGGIK